MPSPKKVEPKISVAWAQPIDWAAYSMTLRPTGAVAEAADVEGRLDRVDQGVDAVDLVRHLALLDRQDGLVAPAGDHDVAGHPVHHRVAVVGRKRPGPPSPRCSSSLAGSVTALGLLVQDLDRRRRIAGEVLVEPARHRLGGGELVEGALASPSP
jgi:hypothetical protein